VQRIPIRQNGRIIAVLGTVLFNDPGEVSKLANQLVHLESKLKMYERKLTSLLSTQYTIDSIIGESEAIKGLKEEAMRAMNNDFPVLITGESGTGKELFAQAIHEGSARRFSPFVHFNCSAIPRDLFESELFGYEKGAFTGANPKGRLGKFELADQGTIFFDEIGELPLEMQPKLLRVLENRQFERIGGSYPVSSDFRVIAATNQNLQELVGSGRFRTDLYYRINVIPLHIPPLRERPEDILSTARSILQKHEQTVPAFKPSIDQEAQECLVSYHWPGNVRELSNVLERTISSIQKESIGYADLPLSLRRNTMERKEQSFLLQEHMQKEEEAAIREALITSGNNKTVAARKLGIHRSLLYKKMRKHGIAL
jgi:transcriptional regulator with PAS, ATPase and Fis domain